MTLRRYSKLLHGTNDCERTNPYDRTARDVDNRLPKVQHFGNWPIPVGGQCQGDRGSWDSDIGWGCFAGRDIRCMTKSQR
jgi:hypothetical protein